jgi:hypothetical protein
VIDAQCNSGLLKVLLFVEQQASMPKWNGNRRMTLPTTQQLMPM